MENKLTDSETLLKVIESLDMTINAFATALEYKSAASVYHVINKVNNLSEGMIIRIVNTFPNVNYDFLKKRGEGSPLLEKQDLQHQANLFNIPLRQQKEKSDLFKWGNIPSKLDRLIELQEENNLLLQEFLSKKKDDQ